MTFNSAKAILNELENIYETGKDADRCSIKDYAKLSLKCRAAIIVPDVEEVSKLKEELRTREVLAKA